MRRVYKTIVDSHSLTRRVAMLCVFKKKNFPAKWVKEWK